MTPFFIARFLQPWICAIALGLWSLGLSQSLLAQSDPVTSNELRELAEHPDWRRLLQYDGNQSAVTSTTFFLAEQGRTNAWLELAATLEALRQAEALTDTHAACRFPARVHWLQQQGLVTTKLDPLAQCAAFSDWANDGDITGASIIFASGYLGNPASYYGHLLINFDHGEAGIANDLLATSVNFGARVPDQENPLTYIAKGLFGGYSATFSRAYFYENQNLYGDEQLRDLWEYRLDLSQDEAMFFAAHMWELLGQEYDYYFARQNCAYRVARILELITGESLVVEQSPWAVPITVFQELVGQTKDGRPLVSETRLIPSRQKRFYQKFSDLNQAEQRAVRAVVAADYDLTIPPYPDLSSPEQVRVVMALLDYLEYQSLAHDEAGSGQFGEVRRRLLVARLQLGQDDTQWAVPSEAPPHLGNRPSVAGLGARFDEEHARVTLRLRATSHDMLSLPAGRVPYSALTMLDLQVAFDDRSFELDYFEALNIETLGLSETGLRGDRNRTWRLRAAIEPETPACTDCIVARLQAGLGHGRALGDWGAVYGFVDLRAQTPGEVYWPLSASINAGLVSRPFRYWAARLETGLISSLNQPTEPDPFVQFEQRLGSSPRWDVRVAYRYETGSVYRLLLNYYW